jgi:hypothetical protein
MVAAAQNNWQSKIRQCTGPLSSDRTAQQQAWSWYKDLTSCIAKSQHLYSTHKYKTVAAKE